MIIVSIITSFVATVIPSPIPTALDIYGLQAASEHQEKFSGDAEYKEQRKQLYTITHTYVANVIIYILHSDLNYFAEHSDLLLFSL